MSSPTPKNDESSSNSLRKITALARCFLVAAFLSATAWGHGPLHERIAELTAEVAKKPDDTELRYQLAEICCQHGDWDTSLKNLNRVDELAPGRFPTDLLRGRVALGAGKAEDAKVALDRFIAAHPRNPQSLTLRARACEQLQKDEQCLDDYRAALAAEAHPEPDLISEVADALAFRGHGDEALRVLDSGMVKLGMIPSLALKAIAMQTAQKQYDEALRRLDMMQKAAPRPEPWMAKRAEILGQAGRLNESRSAWESLVSHLASLPSTERRSRAMSAISTEAQLALEKLSKNAIAPKLSQ